MKMTNLLLALALGAFGCNAWAQSAAYPNKPIRLGGRFRARAVRPTMWRA